MHLQIMAESLHQRTSHAFWISGDFGYGAVVCHDDGFVLGVLGVLGVFDVVNREEAL
jgi:hypothetical protein